MDPKDPSLALHIPAGRPAFDADEAIEIVKATIRAEAQALDNLVANVDQAYVAALELILRRPGKLVITGMGKSGLIARKIAATMSSTGTLAVFLHPGEAMHGDLGVVAAEDVVIAIGKSGESEELISILPVLKKLGTPIIAITANPASSLARHADLVLDSGVGKEACPYDLAPTTSTTAALAIGDALAIALMKIKNFQQEDFALYHPGGKLGRRLLLRVEDLMVPLAQCPVLHPDTCAMDEVIVALGQYGLGVVVFSREGGRLAGILTDGDIRRMLNAHKAGIFDLAVSEVMNGGPTAIQQGLMAIEALRIMEERERPLNVVPVLDGERLVGVARLHDLLKVA